jgi:hypothetical protein
MPETAAHPTREAALASLAIANGVRTTNARWLEALRARSHREGLLAAATLLADGDMKGPAGSIPIYRLLTSIRWVKRVRAEQLLRSASIFQSSRPLRRLSMRQRLLLAGALETAAETSRARQ